MTILAKVLGIERIFDKMDTPASPWSPLASRQFPGHLQPCTGSCSCGDLARRFSWIGCPEVANDSVAGSLSEDSSVPKSV